MKKLTDSAQNRLDNYLAQVRISLHGCRSVDTGEVERDIREHIETELEGLNEPVSFEELEAVLDRLGSPSQWVPDEEIPWWQKMILRLRTGPEDWRLAYLSFGLFVLGFLFPPLFIASFIVSRAALSFIGERKEIGVQKWLIYPSLVIVYLFIAFWLLSWPIFALAILAVEWEHHIRSTYPQFRDDLRYWIMATSFIISGLGLWWTILGAVLLKWHKIPQVLFKPFGNWFSRKWALTLFLAGLLVMSLCGAFGLLYFL